MTSLPPGWHPDPYGGHQQRWWDGQQWTTWTAPLPAPPRRASWWPFIIGLIVVAVIIYVTLHNVRYGHCIVQPGMLDWPSECL